MVATYIRFKQGDWVSGLVRGMALFSAVQLGDQMKLSALVGRTFPLHL